MIKGVTPIETAFEVIGMVNSQAIMKWMFFDTLGGALLFAWGLVTSLMISVEKGSFKAVWTFAFLFFASFFLFVIPTAQVTGVTSTMEQNGYTGIKTQVIMQDKGYGSSLVNPVLNMGSDLISAFTIGAVGVIDAMANGGDNAYLKNQFLVAKIVTLVNQTVLEGIKDPQLRKDTTEFYQFDYLPTLQFLIERNKSIKDFKDLWPGAKVITDAYSTEASTNWTNLKKRLGDYLLQNVTGKTTADSSKIDTSKYEINGEKAVEMLLKNDIKLNPEAYQNATFRGASNDTLSKKGFWSTFGNIVSDVGALAIQPITVSIASTMLHYFVYVQGFCLMLMFTFFPFTVLWMILKRDPGILAEFFKNLFWIKSWTLCWAVINIASVYVWELQRVLHGSSWADAVFESAYFLNITSIFLIATPVVTYSIITGSMTGLGVVATMASLYADKSTELVNKNTTGAIGSSVGGAAKSINQYFTPKDGGGK